MNRFLLFALTIDWSKTSHFHNAWVFTIGEIDTNSLSFYCSIVCKHVRVIDMYSTERWEANLV